jgi:hypothetical protein
MRHTIIAFVELDDGSYVSSAEVTGAQLALAVKRAARLSGVSHYRALLKLQRLFRRAGGTDTETVGELFARGKRECRDALPNGSSD